MREESLLLFVYHATLLMNPERTESLKRTVVFHRERMARHTILLFFFFIAMLCLDA